MEASSTKSSPVKFHSTLCFPACWVFSPGFQVSRLFLLYKAHFSLVFSTVALLLTLPLMSSLLPLSSKVDLRGRAIFRQRRIGKVRQNLYALQISLHVQ